MKGMRMAGRMGTDRVKLKGLKVVKIFADKNYILVSGSVPGHNRFDCFNSEIIENWVVPVLYYIKEIQCKLKF